jgi:hypothetical protein
MDAEPGSAPLNATDLGFGGNEASGWTLSLRGRHVEFRLLQTLDDLRQAERLQEEVFGVSERDLIPANELIVVPETGGAVIGAFLSQQPEDAAGVLVGWGGFVGKPRIVSDFLAVRPEARTSVSRPSSSACKRPSPSNAGSRRSSGPSTPCEPPMPG